MFFFLIPLFALLAWLGPLRAGVADEVIMENGDRLSGEVVREEGGRLKLRTDYAGTLDIDWTRVAEVRLDDSTEVLLDDERMLRVEAVSRDVEHLTLRQVPSSQPMIVDSSRIKTIAPEPWELGRGHRFSGCVNVAVQEERGNSESDELDLDFELEYRQR